MLTFIDDIFSISAFPLFQAYIFYMLLSVFVSGFLPNDNVLSNSETLMRMQINWTTSGSRSFQWCKAALGKVLHKTFERILLSNVLEPSQVSRQIELLALEMETMVEQCYITDDAIGKSFVSSLWNLNLSNALIGQETLIL